MLTSGEKETPIMNLADYLARIGFDRPVRTDIQTLSALCRAHVNAIPFDPLDVAMGKSVTRAPEDAFDKIVRRGRGGWCYEMNGLFAWALEEAGFKVRRLAGGVAREFTGDDAVGNHLMLIVDLDGPWLVDVGFGDGLTTTVPLQEGAFDNSVMRCGLVDMGDGWWRYKNDPRGAAPSYDFNLDVTDEALLEERCRWLQTDPSSPFIQNAVAQRWNGDQHLSLRGRVMQHIGPDGKEQELVETAEEYVRLLKDEMRLDLPEAASLWPKICARHEEVFATAAS